MGKQTDRGEARALWSVNEHGMYLPRPGDRAFMYFGGVVYAPTKAEADNRAEEWGMS